MSEKTKKIIQKTNQKINYSEKPLFSSECNVLLYLSLLKQLKVNTVTLKTSFCQVACTDMSTVLIVDGAPSPALLDSAQ